MNEATKQVLTAVAASAAGAVAAVLITHYLTKKATVQDVATGKTPLPAGSTPTTSGTTPIVATPVTPAPAPQPAPQQLPANLFNVATAMAQAIPKMPCPLGYHAVANTDPTTKQMLPYMCIQD